MAVIDYGNGFAFDADALAVICRRFNVRRLDLFGSATGPDFDPARSDVDLIVEFGPRPPGMTALGQYFDFRDALATLFGRGVDLLETDHIENPYLRRSVEARRRELFSLPVAA